MPLTIIVLSSLHLFNEFRDADTVNDVIFNEFRDVDTVNDVIENTIDLTFIMLKWYYYIIIRTDAFPSLAGG